MAAALAGRRRAHAVWPRTLHAAARALHVGAEAQLTRSFSADEVAAFLALTGDANPIHADAAAARAAGFAAPVLPGILVASLFPAIIGSRYPGAVYVSQTLRFRAPALVGQTVTAKVAVARLSGRRVTFATSAVLHGAGGGHDAGTAVAAAAAVVVDGEALALLTDAAAASASPVQ